VKLEIIFSPVCILLKLCACWVSVLFHEFLFIPGRGFLISQLHCCLDWMRKILIYCFK